MQALKPKELHPEECKARHEGWAATKIGTHLSFETQPDRFAPQDEGREPMSVAFWRLLDSRGVEISGGGLLSGSGIQDGSVKIFWSGLGFI